MVLHADEVKGSRTKGPNTSGSVVTTEHTWHSHASQLFTHLNIFNGLFFFPFENWTLQHMTLGPWVIRATAQLCNKLINRSEPRRSFLLCPDFCCHCSEGMFCFSCSHPWPFLGGTTYHVFVKWLNINRVPCTGQRAKRGPTCVWTLEDGTEEGAATQGSFLLGSPHPLSRTWDLGHLGCPPPGRPSCCGRS